MTKIYEQFDAAFRQVSAYAVFKDAKCVGRVAFKHPKDGAGRLWCYVQVWGAPMVRAFAGGCGYDKQSAAFVNTAAKLCFEEQRERGDYQEITHHVASLKAVKDDGTRWLHQLEDLGYTVQHIID